MILSVQSFFIVKRKFMSLTSRLLTICSKSNEELNQSNSELQGKLQTKVKYLSTLHIDRNNATVLQIYWLLGIKLGTDLSYCQTKLHC